MPTYKKRFSNNNRIELWFVLNPTGATDIAANSSQWAWEVWINEVVPPSVAYNVNRPPDPRAPRWVCRINGQEVGSGYFIYRFWQTSGAIQLGGGTVWLKHGADGTLNVSGSAGASGIPLGSVTVESVGSDNLDAPRIPRGPRLLWGGSWRNTVAYVRWGGSWHIAIPYVRWGGSWHIGGG